MKAPTKRKLQFRLSYRNGKIRVAPAIKKMMVLQGDVHDGSVGTFGYYSSWYPGTPALLAREKMRYRLIDPDLGEEDPAVVSNVIEVKSIPSGKTIFDRRLDRRFFAS